jgi:hypothetical protein
MMLLLVLGGWAWAEPTPAIKGGLGASPLDPPPSQLDMKIVREYEENGESKRAEFHPTLRIAPGADGQLRINDQTLAMPVLQDENAQQMLSSMMKMFGAQMGPMMQQFSNGEPFQLILEVPTMKEKLNIELTPRVDNP